MLHFFSKKWKAFSRKSGKKSKLASYCETIFAARTHYGVFTLGARQTQGCLAGGAGAVNVSFSILEFVFSELEKAHEALIFTATLFKLAREHSAYCEYSRGIGYRLPYKMKNR